MKLRLGIVDGDTTMIEVETLKEAQKIWLAFIKENALGSRDVLGGDIFNEKDEVIAVISYNGRCWEPANYGNEYYQKLESNREIILK